MTKNVKIYDITNLNEEELEQVAKEIVKLNDKKIDVAIEGKYSYSRLLTENILLKYFKEFKSDPWGSYKKYFKSPNNIYPIISIVDFVNNRDINKQVYIRNDLLMDALLLGNTPEQLNMMTYDSLVPYIIEKRQKPDSRKRL